MTLELKWQCVSKRIIYSIEASEVIDNSAGTGEVTIEINNMDLENSSIGVQLVIPDN